jgi:TatD DNase family protein
MKYFDAHCHIQFDAYDADREVVLSRMSEAEVGGLVVGVDLPSSEAALSLVRGAEGASLYAAAGLHPNDVEQGFDSVAFAALVKNPLVRAVGECGLDYYRPAELSDVVKKRQKDIFEEHIQLAVKNEKPLMIHSRPSKGSQDAYYDTLEMLRSKKAEYGDRLRGNMHFFVGGVEEAREFVAIDFTMSYTAVITFTHDYDEVIQAIPLNHLLTETDSPYVAPAPNRGKRNEPLAVREVVRAMARIRNENEEAVRTSVLQNATRLFRIT